MVRRVRIRRRRQTGGAVGGLGAFTLIELLVVVAIIALLVAILTPAIRQAQEVTKTVACAANLRSYQRAMHIWAEENRGHMVPMIVQSTKGVGFNYWWHSLLGSTGGADPDMLPPGMNVPILHGQGEQDKMICPKAWNKSSSDPYIGNYDGTWMYAYNWHVSGEVWFDKPKRFILLADALRRDMQYGTPVKWRPEVPDGPGAWGYSSPYFQSCICYRHEVRVKVVDMGEWYPNVETGSGKANVVFSDGSVTTYLFDASVNSDGSWATGEGQPIPQNYCPNGSDDPRSESEIDEARDLWGCTGQ